MIGTEERQSAKRTARPVVGGGWLVFLFFLVVSWGGDGGVLSSFSFLCLLFWRSRWRWLVVGMVVGGNNGKVTVGLFKQDKSEFAALPKALNRWSINQKSKPGPTTDDHTL